MTQFRKHLLVGITALGLVAGSAAVHAGSPNDAQPTGSGQMGSRNHARSPEQMKQRYAKRQAELHEKLKLTQAQEPAWNAFVAKMKPGARPARPDRAELDKLSAPERMERMLAMMKEHEKTMADRLAAVKEFYAVLTPEQQKVFNEQFGAGWRHRHHQPS